jgi:hypothetical protein
VGDGYSLHYKYYNWRDNVADGNYFANLRDDIGVIKWQTALRTMVFVKIINNQFGSNFLKTLPVKCGGS